VGTVRCWDASSVRSAGIEQSNRQGNDGSSRSHAAGSGTEEVAGACDPCSAGRYQTGCSRLALAGGNFGTVESLELAFS
jgi:hypothetical protein